MSDDLTRRIEAILRGSAQEDHAGYWEAHVPSAARAIAALIAEREAAARKEGCAWADAIERWFLEWEMVPDWFIEWEMVPDWSAADPWAELHRMICWEQKVALDPAVSEDARALQAAARREALEEVARSLTSAAAALYHDADQAAACGDDEGQAKALLCARMMDKQAAALRWPAAMRPATAAEYLDMSEGHFRTHVAPELVAVSLGGRAVGYLQADLDAWLDRRAGRAAPSDGNPWDAKPRDRRAPPLRP